MAASSRFARLLDLAKEPSSEQRRDLLREVTDLFFETSPTRTASEGKLFDDVLRAVAVDMQDSVLRELSVRFAGADDAPTGLMRDLANRAFDIAEPILKGSTALTEQDLVDIVASRSAEHARAIATRPDVTERVSDAIVDAGDDGALKTLLENDAARIGRAAMETAVARAQANEMLHSCVVGRSDMPLDLVNEMYFLVTERLREEILKRNAAVDPNTLDEALERARRRALRHTARRSTEQEQAERDVRARVAAGDLDARVLIAYYRDKKPTHFLCGLAEITGIDFATAEGVIARKDIDALAMICRAANVERPLFVTIAVLACGGDRAIAQAESFGRMYLDVPVESAQRAMRFFRVRKASAAESAAA